MLPQRTIYPTTGSWCNSDGDLKPSIPGLFIAAQHPRHYDSRGMGIYDRDYYRQPLPRGGFGHFTAWSVTTWLIIINVAVFFLDGMLRRTHAPVLDPSMEESAFRSARHAASAFY